MGKKLEDGIYFIRTNKWGGQYDNDLVRDQYLDELIDGFYEYGQVNMSGEYVKGKQLGIWQWMFGNQMMQISKLLKINFGMKKNILIDLFNSQFLFQIHIQDIFQIHIQDIFQIHIKQCFLIFKIKIIKYRSLFIFNIQTI
ncbi:unnamed protein product [Paramecium sonneborni]|uniref:Uncharacterized protein n=1 Tax=Paramecium sonneborni TaxID=65129 RepID=A0A8S1KVS7_9CILI|nr:unnamed protein product [Paramecium sonneborni]